MHGKFRCGGALEASGRPGYKRRMPDRDIVYEAVDAGFAAPAIALATARIFGCGGSVGDVLDLGSGAGVTLEAAAEAATGRLVGVDLSEAACDRARARLAPFGDRVRIAAADILTLDPGALGEFDLIYCIGTLFGVPAPVRARILEIIGHCLRPGGVAVVSYYAGPLHAVRAQYHRMVRSACRTDVPAEEIAFARLFLERLEASLDPADPAQRLQLDAVRMTRACDDVRLLHEVFNPFYEPVITSELERAFAPSGVQFLDYLRAANFGLAPTSEARGVSADALDAQRGNYWHAVFGRPLGDGAADPSVRGITWWTPLYGDAAAPPGVFFTRQGARAEIRSPATAALLARIGSGRLTWAQMTAEAGVTAPTDLATAKADFLQLWRMGLVVPEAAL